MFGVPKTKPLVLILEANPILGASVATMLARDIGIEVLHFEPLPAAFDDLASGRLNPRVVIFDPLQVDVLSPELIGSRSNDGMTDPAFIAYCSVVDREIAQTCIQSGVRGLVTKQVQFSALQMAVSAVLQGAIHIEESFSEFFRTTLIPDPQATPFGRSPAPHGTEPDSDALSSREADVLRQLALGKSMKAVARDLDISIKTVETYKSRAFRKIGLQSRHDLVEFAIRSGWLEGRSQ